MAEDTAATKPATVLLEWTGDRLHYISDRVFLNTGTNEVSTAYWEANRWMVQDLIADPAKLTEAQRKEGRIIEKFAEVQAPPGRPASEGPRTFVVKTAKQLGELDFADAEALIADTHDLALLKKWHKASGSDSIRRACQDQMDKINQVNQG